MRRREFITLLGGAAAAWPMAARAQQPVMPVIGYLSSASAEGYADNLAAVRQGLSDTGFVEGRNLAIEYRFANEQYDKLPALAADLVRRRVAVIFVSGGVVSAIAAKAATTTIPIVFANGSDPVQYGLVASLGRPGGNVTGMTFYNSELGPKRLELLRELLPKSTVIAFLVNPNNPNAEADTREMQIAARTLGVKLILGHASDHQGLENAFANIAQERADALVINIDALFQSRKERVVELAARHALPTMYTVRTFAEVGGLVSYGTNTQNMIRQAGVYVGRILKGEKPADLPVVRPTRFEFILNLKTAKTLGLDIPLKLHAFADEVIE